MATTEQLRFNLDVAPDPENMATRFKLRPTPVVIKKVTPSFPDDDDEPPLVLTLDARMELASRLARRNIEKAILYSNNSVSQTPLTIHNPLPPVAMTTTQSSPTTTSEVSCKRSSKPQVSFKEHAQSKSREVSSHLCSKGQEDSGIATDEGIDTDREEIEKTMSEIRNLRKELTHQMYKLRQFSHQKPLPPHLIPGNIRTHGRLEWDREEEREIEREARRAEEQATRNARLLYQLQQKVRGAQREISKFKGSSQTKKSHAMKQLAAAHRAALRTLHTLVNTATTQGYSTNPKVTSELASLVEQLSHICTQAQISSPVTDNIESQQLQHLLTEFKDYLQTKIQSPYCPNPTVTYQSHLETPVTEAVPIKRKKQLHKSRPKGVLLKPSLRSRRPLKTPLSISEDGIPHFAKQTFSSTLKQSPKKLQPANKPRIPSSIPNSPPPSISSLPTSLSPSLCPKSTNQAEDKVTDKNVPQETNDTSLWPWEKEEQTRRDKEVARQAWLDTKMTEQGRHLDRVQQTTQRELEKLQNQVKRLKKETKLYEKEIKSKRNHKQVNNSTTTQQRLTTLAAENVVRKSDDIADLILDELIDDTLYELGRLDDEELVEEEAKAKLRQPTVESMLLRLEEMEKEKSQIQNRWHSISYTDPLNPHTTTATSRPSASTDQTLSVTGYIPAPLLIPLPPDTISGIHKYQERYNHYLNLTGANTDGGFDPWLLVESICDELFNELVDDSVSEIEGVLDSYVDKLFDNEFHKP